MNKDKNKPEEVFPEFLVASFISKKATASTKALIDQFPKYFRNIKTQKQFYVDMLCLHIDIYHRLGAGLIKDKKSIPSVEMLDERIGTIIGMCCRLIADHSKEFPFLQSIDLQFVRNIHRQFYNWSRQYEKIYDAKNELSVKFDSNQIVGYSIKGQNTLVINFVAKEIATLSVKENDLGKYTFWLSDLIAQYLCDPALESFLHIRKQNTRVQSQTKREGRTRR